jgi:hypothetical protein
MFDSDPFDDPVERRRPTGRRPLLLWIAAGVAIATALALVALERPQHAPTTSQGGVVSASPTAPMQQKTGVGDPPIYWQTIEQEIAQGLHLTIPQIRARLQPPPGQRDGPDISVISAQQGISPSQLRTIEIDAIQQGHALLVRMGYLTQQGSDEGMQTIRTWDDATLNDHVTRWFLNN